MVSFLRKIVLNDKRKGVFVIQEINDLQRKGMKFRWFSLPLHHRSFFPVVESEREEVYRQALKSKVVYLKTSCVFRLHQDRATLSYSVDGKNWVEAIRDFKMIFDYRRFSMGTRFGIYNYTTKSKGGYVDVENFTYIKL